MIQENSILNDFFLKKDIFTKVESEISIDQDIKLFRF